MPDQAPGGVNLPNPPALPGAAPVPSAGLPPGWVASARTEADVLAQLPPGWKRTELPVPPGWQPAGLTSVQAKAAIAVLTEEIDGRVDLLRKVTAALRP